MAQVSAPYNFVPLNEKVFFPPWADLVSHDVPFKNGLTGQIELEITAESPIFIRKPYEEGDAKDSYYTNANGDKISKEFCHITDKDKNKRYYIPGSSIRNMLRSVVEIMGFGKMKPDIYTNRRFGVRDFQNTEVYTLIDNTDDINIGYLVKETDGNYYIYDKGKPKKVPQSSIVYSKKTRDKIVKNNLKDLFNENGNNNRFLKKPKRNGNGYNIKSDRFKTAKFKYEETNLLLDPSKGGYVFTGQPTFNNISKAKTHEFEISALDTDSDTIISVSKDAYNDFKFIYGDYDGGKISVDWKMWKSKLKKGEAIPVFFRADENNQLIDFGLSYLYKMAYKHKVETAIKNIQRDYNSKFLDLAETIFGSIENEKMKGRVSVGHAFCKEFKLGKEYKTVLASPKASYYPFYVEQEFSTLYKIDKRYNTYHDDFVRIHGRKRYPLHRFDIVEASNKQKNVWTFIKTLEKNTIFSTSINFHNLLPAELGALLSAITFHNNDNCRHSIGAGKPFGMGQIKIKTIISNIKSNNRNTPETKIEYYLKEFETEISKKIKDWHKTPQLIELCSMTSTEAKKRFNNFKYMDLRDFAAIKKEHKAMPDFSKMIGYTEKTKSLINGKVDLELKINEQVSHLLSKIDKKIQKLQRQNLFKKKEYFLEDGDYVGTVKNFSESKGFGFIEEYNTGKEYFVHVTGLCEGVKIKPDDFVIFNLEQGRKGLKADNVEPFDENKHSKNQ